jgi:hypothetical protein
MFSSSAQIAIAPNIVAGSRIYEKVFLSSPQT